VKSIVRSFVSVALPLSAVAALGCSRNPNVEIAGSYFPGWMLSLATAVLLTLLAHVLLLLRHGLDRTVGHPAIIYPGMVVLFTCLLWLCFFA
jgi:YtcA family